MNGKENMVPNIGNSAAGRVPYDEKCVSLAASVALKSSGFTFRTEYVWHVFPDGEVQVQRMAVYPNMERHWFGPAPDYEELRRALGGGFDQNPQDSMAYEWISYHRSVLPLAP